MERICAPNLPKNKVKKLIIGEKYTLISQKLRYFGIESLLLPEISEVDPRLSGHADLAVLTYGENAILAGVAGEHIAPELEKLGYKTQLIPKISCKYPEDAVLNACVMGDHIIHNRKFSVLKDEAGFINVRQGYAKCNICPVTENALITSDSGIAEVCREHGIDVLQIRPGYISLPGFDTGFIGGASFKLAPDIMAFTGDVHRHPDGNEIVEFLTKYNISAVCLGYHELLDIGSAVLLTEEDI